MPWGIVKTGGRVPSEAHTWWVVDWTEPMGIRPALPVIGTDVKHRPIVWRTKAGAQSVVDQIMANRGHMVDKSAVYEPRER